MSHPIFSKKAIRMMVGSVILGIVSSILYDFGNHYFFSIYGIIFSTCLFLVGYTFVIIQYITYREKINFRERTALHHSIIHQARDLGIKIMNEKSKRQLDSNMLSEALATAGCVDEYLYELDLILTSMTYMFKKMVPPNTKVWACLRERRSDDNYYTIVRAGDYAPLRSSFSQSLSSNAESIQRLLNSYKLEKNCVYFTGSKKRDWNSRDNDIFNEDLSVMMGAVISKQWTKNKFDSSTIDWILFINADKEDMFNENYSNLMKCCNDVLSWLLNTIVRHKSQVELHD